MKTAVGLRGGPFDPGLQQSSGFRTGRNPHQEKEALNIGLGDLEANVFYSHLATKEGREGSFIEQELLLEKRVISGV